MTRVMLLLLVFSPLSIAAPLQLQCEGPEETQEGNHWDIVESVSHRVVLDKDRGTITIGERKVAYYLSDPPTIYKADDAAEAMEEERDMTYVIGLHRHKLELYYNRKTARRTWVTFVGSCVFTE